MSNQTSVPQAHLSTHFQQNRQTLDQILQIDQSFDLLVKPLQIGGRQAALYFIDGFIKDEVMEKILEVLTGRRRGSVR